MIVEHETRVKPVSVEGKRKRMLRQLQVRGNVQSEGSVERMAGKQIKGTIKAPERNLVAKSVVQTGSI